MKKIKLNDYSNMQESNDGYFLREDVEYIIDLEKEIEFQSVIKMSFDIMGIPPALKNYHAWLYENGFDTYQPNPTNEFVSLYYGVKSLWKTPYSLGIVVKAENDDDYYIVMECSSKNRGFKHTQVVLTPGGCS